MRPSILSKIGRQVPSIDLFGEVAVSRMIIRRIDDSSNVECFFVEDFSSKDILSKDFSPK